MTVAMSNNSAQSSRDRAQSLYNKNLELENRRQRSAQARSDPNAWQRMREKYEATILEDHEFSEQHEVEYALWQLHYRRIEELRTYFSAALASAGSNVSQNGKGAARPDRITKLRSQFKDFLTEATGFYHELILKIKSKFGLPLGSFSGNQGNDIFLLKEGSQSTETKNGLVSCHRCLIYLGDLARYKGLYGESDSKVRDFTAASSYYAQASSLLPSSGNPHHQLAIIATYSGNELVAIYRYFRSLAVDNPFSTARENLIIAFEKNRQTYSQLPDEVKPSPVKSALVQVPKKARGKGEIKVLTKEIKTEAYLVKERAPATADVITIFSIRFVRLNGILFTRTSLETFEEVFSKARCGFLELLSSGPEDGYGFGSSAAESGLLIVRIVAILIFSVHNVNKETENQSNAEKLQRSVVLQNAFTAIFQFMGIIFQRCIQLHDPAGSCLLPGVLVFVEWLACHPDITAGSAVEDEQSAARRFFWSHCITFMNKLLECGVIFMNENEDDTCFFNMSAYEEGETVNRVALWEDLELRGFVPLLPAQLILDFSRKHSLGTDGSSKEKKIRLMRILSAGKALSNLDQVGQMEMCFHQKMRKFLSASECVMPDNVLLTSAMEVPIVNGLRQELIVSKSTIKMKNLPETPLPYVDREEDEEIIVFKPSMTDKHVDGLKVVSSEGPGAAVVGWGNHVEPTLALHDSLLLSNAFDVDFRTSTSLANVVPRQSIPPSMDTLKWVAETQDFIATGMDRLSIMDNKYARNLKLDGSEIVDPPASFQPQFVNPSVGGVYLNRNSDAVIPSKFDSIMSSGLPLNPLPANSSSAVSVSARKTPVGRPVRHIGPPPGFDTAPPNHADLSLPEEIPKNENLLMDDYTWLDGYQLPSSAKGRGYNGGMNFVDNLSRHSDRSNDFTEPLSLPLPRKLVPLSRGQVDSYKGLDYQFPGLRKLHNEQQLLQKLQNVNQQVTSLQEQYKGEYMWDNFYV